MSQSQSSPNPFDPPQADCGPPPTAIEPSAARLDPPITVRGHVSRSELQEARHLAGGNRTSPAEFWSAMATLFLAVQAIAGLLAITEHPWSATGYIWLTGALALLYYSVAVVAPSARERSLDALEREAEEVEFAMTTDGFMMHKEDSQIQAAWVAVKGFYDSQSLIVLIWEGQQLVLARRWFADDGDFSRLVIFLGHKLEMLG